MTGPGRVSDPRTWKSERWLDAGLAVALAGVTALHCWWLPHALGASDEGLFFYEAKRVSEGAVLYRDVFDLITPLAILLQAALFRLLGATASVALGTDAIVQGAIALAIFAIARRVGVRRGLAALAALAHPAWFHSAWAMASPHWISTLLALGLLMELVRAPAARPDHAGLWAGLAIAVQQQRGVPLAGVAAAVVVLDAWIAGAPGGPRGVVRRLAAFAGGLLLVVLPVGGYIVWTAGVRPVFDALVIHPIVNYRRLTHGVATWGSNLTPEVTQYTVPRVLPWLAVFPPLELVRAVIERGGGAPRWRRSAVLGAYGLTCMASIRYFPDVVHVGFISPILAIVAADLVEAMLRIVPRQRPWRLVASSTLGVALVLVLLQMRAVRSGLWRDFPVAYATPFGLLQFRDADDVALRERLRELVDAAPGRRVFIHPGGAALYLETGAVNPTPFQIVLPQYNTAEHVETITGALDHDATPYVVRLLKVPGDPLERYLEQHYEPAFEEVQGVVVFRRRAAASVAVPPSQPDPPR